MAVWCASSGDISKTSMETHFNFWRLAGDKRFFKGVRNQGRDFIEIGVLITNPTPIQSICIYLPIAIRREDTYDSGALLEETSVAQGIFNEKLDCVKKSSPDRIDLKTDNKLFCVVHKFIRKGGDIDPSHLEITNDFASGTIIKITKTSIDSVCHQIADGDKIYFRLRIYLPADKASPFIRVISPWDRRFQSGFEEIEYIDFRLNELRTLPPQVENRIRDDEKGVHVPITLVAFLTAFPVQSELSASSIHWHKTRLLEHDPWNGYVPGGIPGGMVVYHGRKDNIEGVSDFSSFVKLHTRRSGRRILITYLLIAFLFGLAGNVTGSFAYSWLDGPQHSNQRTKLNSAVEK